MTHECNSKQEINQLKENYYLLKEDIEKLDNTYVELTNAITSLTTEIETNRYWHKMTVSILTVTLCVIFGILNVCLNMM